MHQMLDGEAAAMGGGDETEEFCTCVPSLVSRAVQRGVLHLPEVRQLFSSPKLNSFFVTQQRYLPPKKLM
jgi:hypothetical protein